ncbi:MAG: flagellar protein FlaG [Defluviitaleaceae bacterium]|nr:flagellar protein FlaG [Defluviitaleaceae bacterium]
MNINEIRPQDFIPQVNFTPQMPETNLDPEIVAPRTDAIVGLSGNNTSISPEARINYLNNLVSEINNFTLPGRRLNIEIHEPTGRLLVSVHDSETGELVREVPSRSELDLAYLIRQHAGAMFDINL